MQEEKIDIFQSDLVPKHEIMSGEEKAELLERLNVSSGQLPKIREEDPVVKLLGAKKGDVLRITRKSPVALEYFYYRVVI
ncbi:MAG: DNA-directed RNA polymerase subunit H [Candidatus Aenigmarchaeota archaeon]|nr:DNA-directed RNA polymerase subunit H [Candidatus Aenigmarchaeota archaeon]